MRFGLCFLLSVLMLLGIMETSKYYQRVQIQFMTHLGMKGTAVHHFLMYAHGLLSFSKCTVYRWMKCFQNGHTDCRDTPRSGHPMKLMPTKPGQICLLLNGDHTLSIRRLSTLMNLGFGTVQKGLRKCLELRKRPSCWVPHDLTLVQ